MTNSPLDDLLRLEVASVLLVFMRIYGLVQFMPILSSQALPVSFRTYFVIAMTMLVSTVVPPPITRDATMVSLIVTMAGELAIGALIGSLVQFIFSALQLAGQVSGTQLGLALASVVNPQFDDQASTTSVIYATIASLAFFVTGLDRELFALLLDTFQAIPLAQVAVEDSFVSFVLHVFGQSMVLAVRIATPVTLALFLAELAMGFVGRTVPQLNVLSVGFSVRILLGLFVTMAGLADVGSIFCDYVTDALVEAHEAIADWIPAEQTPELPADRGSDGASK